MEMKDGSVRRKIDSLMAYRQVLDESEREFFDVMMEYANEVAIAVERGIAPTRQAC